MMNCELLATCSALGYLEGDVYHREPDCLGTARGMGGRGKKPGGCGVLSAPPAESVKDLIRYLRHEDESRDVRQQLGAAQILQNDLLPLLVQYPRDRSLFDAVVRYRAAAGTARGCAPTWAAVPSPTPPTAPRRLMVNLTQPALLCFGKVPSDATARHHFLQVLSYLQAYKEVRVQPRGDSGWGGLQTPPQTHRAHQEFFLQAFASEKVFGVLSEKLYEVLQLVGAGGPGGVNGAEGQGAAMGLGSGEVCGSSDSRALQDWEQRQEEDALLIERILLLVRNVLHVPPDPAAEQVMGGEGGTDPGIPTGRCPTCCPRPVPPPRVWMAMPACTTACCGLCTSVAWTTCSSSWPAHRLSSSGLCTSSRSSPSCSVTRWVWGVQGPPPAPIQPC